MGNEKLYMRGNCLELQRGQVRALKKKNKKNMKSIDSRVEEKSTKTTIIKRKRTLQGLWKVVEEACVNSNLLNSGSKYFMDIYRK